MEISTETVGIISGICTSVSMLPQLIKLIKEKESKDLSMGMLCVLIVGLAGWIYYGFLKKDAIIIVTNSFSFLVNCLTVFFGLKYKKAG